MVYGKCTPGEHNKEQGWFTLWCSNKRITIKNGQNITILCDPFCGDEHHDAAYFKNITFDELFDNIDQDKTTFIDDLMYMCGISVD